ncbi:right-handed parallel beta-helix repeat-containing protein [Mariniflexile ostreae]|uniref:Right-handed parallel beta-helix repeat-containing protein n=1 Tax=Mariniflexile ostreae TaxID=1520892 RepID=A0ABV5FD00_9FLAO
MKYIVILLLSLFLFNCSLPEVGAPKKESIEKPDEEVPEEIDIISISSLEELREYAAKDDVHVKMAAGTYLINDASYFKELNIDRYDDTNDQIPDGTYAISTLFHFSGNNNIFDLEGVVINVDTAIYPSIDNNGKINEVFIDGTNNIIKGLSFNNLGDGYTAPYTDGTSAIMLTVSGVDNTLEDVSLYITGSWPYGYGQLLGKSSDALVSLHKHSSLLVTGTGTKLLRCNVITRAFGHGIVLQGAVNTLIEDCYVEGEMRSTDDILEGDLSDITQYVTVDGKQVPKSYYAPGYFEKGHMISMNEDGVRTYLDGPFSYSRTKKVTVVNTTVKNMRSGFVLVHGSGEMTISNSTAIGCESAFSGGTGIEISKSKGDAQYGPLLTFPYKNSRNCVVDLELINTESDFPPQRLVEIIGNGHNITIKNHENKVRATPLPIVFGESTYADDKFFRGFSYSEYAGASTNFLNNKTQMPIVFTDLADSNSVTTNGTVTDNGQSNIVN